MGTVTVMNTYPEANVAIQLPIKIQELIKAVQKGAKRKSPGPDQDPGFPSDPNRNITSWYGFLATLYTLWFIVEDRLYRLFVLHEGDPMETSGTAEELHCIRQLSTGLWLNDTQKLETHVNSGIANVVSQQTPTWWSIHPRQSRSDDKRHPLRASMTCRRHRFEGPPRQSVAADINRVLKMDHFKKTLHKHKFDEGN